MSGINEIVWALKALQLTDLTTLAGDDTPSNVRRLCIRAAHPFTDYELRFLDKDVKHKIHTAAVCVYPSRVHDAHETLKSLENGDKVEIAAGTFRNIFFIFKIKIKINYKMYFIRQLQLDSRLANIHCLHVCKRFNMRSIKVLLR